MGCWSAQKWRRMCVRGKVVAGQLGLRMVVEGEAELARFAVGLGRLSVAVREMQRKEEEAVVSEGRLSAVSLWLLLPRARLLERRCYSRGCRGLKKEVEAVVEERASEPVQVAVLVLPSAEEEAVPVEEREPRREEVVEVAREHPVVVEELRELLKTASGSLVAGVVSCLLEAAVPS